MAPQAPSNRWHPCKYSTDVVRRFLRTQFDEYAAGVRKADCHAELRRRLGKGPPVCPPTILTLTLTLTLTRTLTLTLTVTPTLTLTLWLYLLCQIWLEDKHALPVPEDDTHVCRVWSAETRL